MIDLAIGRTMQSIEDSLLKAGFNRVTKHGFRCNEMRKINVIAFPRSIIGLRDRKLYINNMTKTREDFTTIQEQCKLRGMEIINLDKEF